jgi:hypothetical protein
VADVEHGERLINTNDAAALEALRHRPSHSTGTRRHVENLLIALQRKHFSQFLGEISTDLRGAPIKLCRVLRVVEMSLVPVAMTMPMFANVSMLVVVPMLVSVLVVMVMPMNVLVIVCVLMPVFVVVFMTVMMSMVMFVAVLVLVTMLLAVLVMLMFVSVTVLMVTFVFFAHGFTLPSLKFD